MNDGPSSPPVLGSFFMRPAETTIFDQQHASPLVTRDQSSILSQWPFPRPRRLPPIT
jgi:hypothetical protein